MKTMHFWIYSMINKVVIYSKIDQDKVIPCLKQKAKDQRFEGQVEDALDDIEMFAK